MDDKALLLAQIRALLQQLKWAETSLSTTKIDPPLSLAARNGFEILFRQRRNDLDRMETSLLEGRASAGAWKELRSHSVSCVDLFKECLGFLGGALLRSENRGNDICEIADALLLELTGKMNVKWSGVTLLADGHFFTETTGLIRLPFPDYGTWNLPIAVHELGHFVGPRIPDGRGGFPFQELEQKTRANFQPGPGPSPATLETQLSHLREFFSDLFAVFALGPAYACSCLLLHFNPRDCIACVDGKTHPSHAKRAHFILQVLKQMNRSTPGQPYTNILQNLAAIWENKLRSAAEPECLPPKEIPKLDYQLTELHRIVAVHLNTLKYDGWDLAIELSERLASYGEGHAQVNDSISSVLNGQWLWRLQQTTENANDAQRVNLRASALCRQIIVRRQNPGMIRN